MLIFTTAITFQVVTQNRYKFDKKYRTLIEKYGKITPDDDPDMAKIKHTLKVSETKLIHCDNLTTTNLLNTLICQQHRNLPQTSTNR